MSERLRRALADDEESGEIQPVEAAPARRAVEVEDSGEHPVARPARAVDSDEDTTVVVETVQPVAPAESEPKPVSAADSSGTKTALPWKGPMWAVALTAAAIVVSLITTAIPQSQRTVPAAQLISSGRTLFCPPSQGKANLSAGTMGGNVQVGTSSDNLSEKPLPAVTKIDNSAGYVRSVAGQRPPTGSALSAEKGMTTWVPCVGAATGGAVSLTNPSASDLVVVNSDTRAATVDIALLGATGDIDSAGMRGIRVSPGQTKVLPLSAWANVSTPVTALVDSREGRVVVGARTWAPKGRETIAMAPADKTVYLPGVPAKVSTATLVIANPGTARLSVSVTALAGRGSFTPEGADEIDIDPRSTIQVDLAKALAGEAVGLKLSANDPLVARLFVQGKQGTTDYALVGPGTPSKVLQQTLGADGTLELSNPGRDAVTFTGTLTADGGKQTALNGTVPAGSTWSGKVPGVGHLHIEGSAPLTGAVVSSSGLAVLPLDAVATSTNGRRASVDPQLR
ncbi:DUF5719 family protein [Cutibacterium sp.]|uniref:DUF5719 family protein n=1 Tax=Cutibacterium sp. TaxID=1912221 RepID=UPI0026DBB313|nr:DUF5719 family protein [Cutibacterium sp.]MDO4413340.1 DUF5719 family protein [Cutibacterium sp.]